MFCGGRGCLIGGLVVCAGLIVFPEVVRFVWGWYNIASLVPS